MGKKIPEKTVGADGEQAFRRDVEEARKWEADYYKMTPKERFDYELDAYDKLDALPDGGCRVAEDFQCSKFSITPSSIIRATMDAADDDSARFALAVEALRLFRYRWEMESLEAFMLKVQVQIADDPKHDPKHYEGIKDKSNRNEIDVAKEFSFLKMLSKVNQLGKDRDAAKDDLEQAVRDRDEASEDYKAAARLYRKKAAALQELSDKYLTASEAARIVEREAEKKLCRSMSWADQKNLQHALSSALAEEGIKPGAARNSKKYFSASTLAATVWEIEGWNTTQRVFDNMKEWQDIFEMEGITEEDF